MTSITILLTTLNEFDLLAYFTIDIMLLLVVVFVRLRLLSINELHSRVYAPFCTKVKECLECLTHARPLARFCAHSRWNSHKPAPQKRSGERERQNRDQIEVPSERRRSKAAETRLCGNTERKSKHTRDKQLHSRANEQGRRREAKVEWRTGGKEEGKQPAACIVTVMAKVHRRENKSVQ